MPIFSYKGIDVGGKKVSGTIEADTVKTARAKLRKINIFPTDVLESGKGQGGSFGKDSFFSKYFNKVKIQDLATMTRQLSTLINANIPLVDSLTALVDQVQNPILKEALSKTREKVTEGARLADSLKSYPHIFDELYISMVTAGEASGALDTVLLRLAEITESQARLRSKVKGALTYPVVMAIVGSVMMALMLIFVVPKIVKVFEDSGAELPLPTRMLIGTSDFLQSYWYLILLALPFIFYVFRRFKKTEKGRELIDRYTLKAPIFGEMFRMIAVSRFCRTMATMLGAGVQLLTAMDIVKNIVQNTILTRVIEETKLSVKEGESIAEPLRRSQQFPPMVTQMISIGEKTGELEKMLERVADNYDDQVNTKVSSLTTLMEPLMILVMGVVVGGIVLSLMLPMLNMNSLVK